MIGNNQNVSDKPEGVTHVVFSGVFDTRVRYSVGDKIQVTELDHRWWKRLWCLAIFRPPPTKKWMAVITATGDENASNYAWTLCRPIGDQKFKGPVSPNLRP
jgi:hypothetical protein